MLLHCSYTKESLSLQDWDPGRRNAEGAVRNKQGNGSEDRQNVAVFPECVHCQSRRELFKQVGGEGSEESLRGESMIKL